MPIVCAQPIVCANMEILSTIQRGITFCWRLETTKHIKQKCEQNQSTVTGINCKKHSFKNKKRL